MMRLTAIKPPIKKGFKASDLFKADMTDMETQVIFLSREGVVPAEKTKGNYAIITKDNGDSKNTKKFNPFEKY